MTPYAHICQHCDHPQHAHELVEGGDVREGPYRCHCGCEISQDAPWYPMSQREFQATFRVHGGQG